MVIAYGLGFVHGRLLYCVDPVELTLMRGVGLLQGQLIRAGYDHGALRHATK